MRLKWEEGKGLAGWAGGSDEEEDVGGDGRHDEIGAGYTGRVELSATSSSMVGDVLFAAEERKKMERLCSDRSK